MDVKCQGLPISAKLRSSEKQVILTNYVPVFHCTAAIFHPPHPPRYILMFSEGIECWRILETIGITGSIGTKWVNFAEQVTKH